MFKKKLKFEKFLLKSSHFNDIQLSINKSYSLLHGLIQVPKNVPLQPSSNSTSHGSEIPRDPVLEEPLQTLKPYSMAAGNPDEKRV